MHKIPEGTKIFRCVLLVTLLKKEMWVLFLCVKEPVTSSAGRTGCSHQDIGGGCEGTAFRTVSCCSCKCWPLPVISPPLLTLFVTFGSVFSSTWSEQMILGLIPSEDQHQNSHGAKAVTWKESDLTDPQLIYANVYASPTAKL